MRRGGGGGWSGDAGRLNRWCAVAMRRVACMASVAAAGKALLLTPGAACCVDLDADLYRSWQKRGRVRDSSDRRRTLP